MARQRTRRRRQSADRPTQGNREQAAEPRSAQPPRPNPLALAASVLLFGVWFLLLVWLAWRINA